MKQNNNVKATNAIDVIYALIMEAKRKNYRFDVPYTYTLSLLTPNEIVKTIALLPHFSMDAEIEIEKAYTKLTIWILPTKCLPARIKSLLIKEQICFFDSLWKEYQGSKKMKQDYETILKYLKFS